MANIYRNVLLIEGASIEPDTRRVAAPLIVPVGRLEAWLVRELVCDVHQTERIIDPKTRLAKPSPFQDRGVPHIRWLDHWLKRW